MNRELTTEEKTLIMENAPITDNQEPHASIAANNDTVTSNTNKSESSQSTFFALIRKYASVSDALRMFGALGVAMAMGLFLLEGIEVANDLYRFLTMLGLTTALTAAGLLMSMILKEQRGSRVFISLGLLSIPVNFTVFGALIYSMMPQNNISTSYPDFALWQVTNASELPLALIAGVLVLLPVIWLGFTVLARSERLWLSTALVTGSIFLMIPVRQELFSAAIALASAASIGWLVRKNHNNSLALKTPEGRFAIALLFVAPIIIAVRSLFLYEASGILMLTLASLFYFFTRQLMARRTEATLYTAILTVLASSAALFITVTTADVIAYNWLSRWDVIVGSAILLLLALDTNNVSPHRKVANITGTLMVVGATAALVLLAITTSLPAITTAAIVILIAATVYGYLFKKSAVIISALIGIVTIVGLNAQVIWFAAQQTGWWGIGAVGALAIIAGSMLDRAGTIVEVKQQPLH